MVSKDEAYKLVEQLVQRFGEQIDSYKSGEYNETLTRRDFIDPFFKTLGWDIDNSQGYAEAYREVIHEDKVKIGKATKAPDYSFRLPGGKRLFFVEAKKPSIVVKDDISVSYQVRRYGWNAKLAISIVTDFEEFAVYDCTKKPNPTDKSSNARIKYITYDKYLDEFEYLWEIFSKEQVLKGSFDKYVKSDTVKKGTTTVDKEFLLSLDTWRNYLATSISIKNKQLDEDEINFVVQQTIDRLIFLRIAEDRGVEPYGQIKASVNAKGDSYQNLFFNFKKADEKYNSGLFDFKKDRISENLVIDNKVIKTIVNEMYFPSPYEFSEIPIEILGSVYEQFLGKQIKIDSAHRVKIEEKPEVRKAGGVYYTPQYVVEYIVKNTVGKLIEGKTPKQISDIKIVDPACGSGSFLIGAYQFLLDYHKNYYTDNGTKTGKKDSPTTPQGNLTSAEKKRILLNNIYGVDIDTNAVEVTKLSLLLKCMEGETETSLSQQYQLWHERILPSLDNNIKSGNSLVDIDYCHDELVFDAKAEKKIRPFNWQRAFPEVFKIKPPTITDEFKLQFKRVDDTQKKAKELLDKMSNTAEEPKAKYDISGGFDIVIGNPPYVRQELIGLQKTYFENKYRVYHGMADLYSYFIERSFQLLNANGLYGVIVANKWMRANYGEPLRQYLKKQTIEQIIDFGDLPVFETATTYPCILLARKGNLSSNDIEITNIATLDFDKLEDYVLLNKRYIKQSSIEDSGWNLAGEIENNLLIKIKSAGIPLGEYVKWKIFRGIVTGLNEAFVINEVTKNKLIAEDSRSKEIIKPYLAGRDIKRYQKPKSEKYLIFAYKNIDIDGQPAIKKHLEFFKNKLEKRAGNQKWYELQSLPGKDSLYSEPKIMYPDIAIRTQAIIDTKGFYSVNTVYNIGVADKYLLAILNSQLFHYYFSKITNSIRGGYLRFFSQYIEKFPIVRANQSIDIIINLVDLITNLNSELQSVKLPDKMELLKSRIGDTNNRIDEIVYQLYGLGQPEIDIIEGKD